MLYICGWVLKWLLELKHVMATEDAQLNGAALGMVRKMVDSVGQYLPRDAKLAPSARLVRPHASVVLFHLRLELYVRQHLMTPRMLLVHGADLRAGRWRF